MYKSDGLTDEEKGTTMIAVAKKARDDFEEWIAQRSKWIQTAAARIVLSQKLPSREELSELADLALAEAAGLSGTSFEKFPSGVFVSRSAVSDLRLQKIENVIGVNALQHGVNLEFQGDITVVFGQNGSGKSGFARLIKHACGARTRIELVPDVFSANPPEPEAQIAVSENGTPAVFSWRMSGGSIEGLRHVHVFDSVAAARYFTAGNEATYEPKRLRFLSSLVEVADLVSAELRRRKSALTSTLPAFPRELEGTAAEIFLSNLRHDVQDVDVEAMCIWSEYDSERKKAIEASLKETDVAGRLKEVTTRKKGLALFETQVTGLKRALSNSNTAVLIKARSDAMAKRKAASEDAERVFRNAALDGVGKESWRLLWERARAYSELSAYPGTTFPVMERGSRCVLCHQLLDAESRKRFIDFEMFVKGGLEAAATTADTELKRLWAELPTLPEKMKWLVDAEAIGMDEAQAERLLSEIEKMLLTLKSPTIKGTVNYPVWRPLDKAIEAARLSLTQLETALAEVQKSGKRDEQEKLLRELRAAEWFYQNGAAVRAEVIRLRAVHQIEEAERLANTHALTQKKNALAEDELARGYRERFLVELELLGGKRLSIEPVPLQEGKGKVSFSLSFKNAKQRANAETVLSEGENRIVALAAFLADMTGSDQTTPFIFDDPISSLDQEYEERVVERLVDLARTRQVVIFTHRLSLLALLEDATEAAKRVATEIAPTLSIVTLRRIGTEVGMVDELDVRHKKPRSGFAVLRDQKIPQIRKHMEVGNATAYESALKMVCGDFRVLIERTIEKVMLDGLMERFRRSMQTKQIMTLAKINADDCALIDVMMTKYSRFEHSQPDELASNPPSPDELATDLDKVITWIDEFGKRKNSGRS
ncbi:MAG: chromosome segregation protein SMC [Bacilli bacterium]|jgi:hypothetical protein